jgi:hypothetical protein
MTEPKTAPSPHPSTRDLIRRAYSINRAALEAVHGLLQAPPAHPECFGGPGWSERLGIALAEECLSLEVVRRCLAQQGAALEDPALKGLAESVQALERTVLTLREVRRKKLMLASLAAADAQQDDASRWSESQAAPIKALGDAVRREAVSLVKKLADQQAMLDRAVETRAALVQQVFSG